MQYFPALLNKFPFYRLQLFGEKPHDVRFKMFFFPVFFNSRCLDDVSPHYSPMCLKTELEIQTYQCV